MEFDTKQKILIAIYTEYQKDIPDMRKNIKAHAISIDNKTFFVALEKLENEGYITGVRFIRSDEGIITAFTNDVMMTRDGLEYVETKLNILKTLTGKEKLLKIVKDAPTWGWDQLKDLAARTLAEMAKQ